VGHDSFVHDSFARVTWLIHERDNKHSLQWRQHTVCSCPRWRAGTCVCMVYICMDSFIWRAMPVLTCDITHSSGASTPSAHVLDGAQVRVHVYFTYIFTDSFICGTCLIRMRDVTHSYGWHDSFICVTWLIYLHTMPHSCTCHDWFIRVQWLIHNRGDMTHTYVW